MGMTYIQAALYLGSGVSSYQRRFPVVYLTLWAMRRPRFVNEQLEVCAFIFVSDFEKQYLNNRTYEKTNFFNHLVSFNKHVCWIFSIWRFVVLLQ